jgi:putative SbcD/Mre11-related phosphoesterase
MNLIKPLPGIGLADLAVYLEKERFLVIGDLHFGFEEALARKGTLLPRFQFKDTIARLEKIFASIGKKLEAVVVNGDLKHEFANISEQEWREILKFLDFLLTKSGQVIIVKGNHDVKLAPIARKRGIVVVETLAVNDKFICHGDIVPVG